MRSSLFLILLPTLLWAEKVQVTHTNAESGRHHPLADHLKAAAAWFME